MEIKERSKGVYNREEFGALSFWAWNEDMNDESINRRIEEFHAQGLQGFFMHARAGNLTPYLSKEWFRACKTCISVAKKLGMQVWIYDEDGWPSGFAGGLVNNQGERYQSKYIKFTDNQANVDKKHFLAAYKKTAFGYIKSDEEVSLWAYYVVEPDYVDLLAKEVTDTFIKTTHEAYKREIGEEFGKTVRGIFTDEPQYNHNGYPFSLELEEFFVKRNGYSFVENAYHLCESVSQMEQENSKAATFLHDYWTTVEEMMRMNFSKQIFDWCEENHLQFTGHYPGEDSLIHQIGSTAGVMPKYEFMHMPGIDHLGRRITPILLTKQVTSAAKQFGKKKVISETFGCGGWNISFSQMCHIWGWQAAAGINVPCLHIGTHSMKGIRKRDYPAFYSYQEPWWDEFHHVSQWMEGIGYKLSQGKSCEDILVISPMQSIYLYHREGMTQEEQMYAAAYRKLLENLLDVQANFDIGDETILATHSHVVGTDLVVGKCTYNKVIVPLTATLEKSTWELLRKLQANGGTVVFTDMIPKFESGLKVRSNWTDGTVTPNRQGFWYKYFARTQYNRNIEILDSTGFFVAEGLYVATRLSDDVTRCFIWNHRVDGTRHLKGKIIGQKICYKVNAETFERVELAVKYDSAHTYFPVELENDTSVLYEFEEGVSNQEKEEVISLQKFDAKISLCDLNCLTLDHVSYSYDGISFSEPMAIVKLHKELYQNMPQKEEQNIYIRYEFENQSSKAINLEVCIESDELVDLTCNGTSIFVNANGFFTDECIKRYSIMGYVQPEKNEIIATYSVKNHIITDVDDLFETQRNRFFYPVEPEAVYVRGEFDVGYRGVLDEKPTHMSVKDAEFYITDSTLKTNMDNLTKQGLWFYRGNVAFTGTIYKTNKRQYLQLNNLKGALAVIRCNGEKKAVYRAPYDIEISDMLKDGENIVEVCLFGTNRNLLGPHHHQKGENNYVGLNVFNGVYGYEDIIVNPDLTDKNTWTDAYCFVEFGLDNIVVVEKQ